MSLWLRLTVINHVLLLFVVSVSLFSFRFLSGICFVLSICGFHLLDRTREFYNVLTCFFPVFQRNCRSHNLSSLHYLVDIVRAVSSSRLFPYRPSKPNTHDRYIPSINAPHGAVHAIPFPDRVFNDNSTHGI